MKRIIRKIKASGKESVVFNGDDNEVMGAWIALRAELPRPIDMRHGYVEYPNEVFYVN